MTEFKKIKIEIKFKENSSVTKVSKKIKESFIPENNIKTILKNIIICFMNEETKIYVKNYLNSKEEKKVNKIDEFKKIYHRYITNLNLKIQDYIKFKKFNSTNNNNFLKDYRKYLREISIRYFEKLVLDICMKNFLLIQNNKFNFSRNFPLG